MVCERKRACRRRCSGCWRRYRRALFCAPSPAAGAQCHPHRPGCAGQQRIRTQCRDILDRQLPSDGDAQGYPLCAENAHGPASPLAIRWRYLPKLTPWLVRFPLASRLSRAELLSLALVSLQKQAVRAYADLVPVPDRDAALFTGGHLLTCGSKQAFEKATYSIHIRRARGIDIEILDAAGVAAAYPILAGRINHGVIVNGSYYADPQTFTRAVASRFTDAGRRWLQCTGRAFRIKRDRIGAVPPHTFQGAGAPESPQPLLVISVGISMCPSSTKPLMSLVVCSDVTSERPAPVGATPVRFDRRGLRTACWLKPGPRRRSSERW